MRSLYFTTPKDTMYVRATVVLGLLLGVTGCASKMGASAAAPYEGYAEYEDYGAYDEMDASADYDKAEMAVLEPEPMDAPSFKSKRADRRARRAERGPGGASGGSAAPASPADASEPAPEANAGGGEAEKAVADDGAQDHGRHIIYTATMQLAVFNLEDAMKRAESLPDKYGGFVQNMSASYFVMRIPAANLRKAMDELAGLGIVQNRTLDAQDVTEEFLDIETRIAVLEATQKQMMELLTKARTVDEALKVPGVLAVVTGEDAKR